MIEKRKRYTNRIIQILIVSFFCFFAAYSFGQIPISTIEELQKIGNDPGYPLNGSYTLVNDIEASSTKNWNEGKGFDPIGGEFTGTLDGQGYTIYNLYINRPDENYVGIFTWIWITINKDSIKNIYLTNFDISGKNAIGALCGYGGNVLNCHASGVINSTGGASGGLIGLSSGNIINCSSEGMIVGKSSVGGLIGSSNSNVENCFSSCIVKGDTYVGGLIGTNNSHIIKSYSSGIVEGNMYVGGLVGSNDGKIYNSYSNVHVVSPGTNVGGLAGINYWWIERCYATGRVDAGDYLTGGLVGSSSIRPYGPLYWIAASFYDSETTGKYSPGGFNQGYPKTTVEMMTPSTFTNWDFVNTWFMVPGKSYPVLRPERYVGVQIKPIPGTPNPKPSLPVEFTISFDEPVRNFTYDDLDFSSSTLQGIQGTLEIEDVPTTVGIMDCFTTWTLTITDSSTSYGLIVMKIPLASAMNAANYPSAESEYEGIYILSEHLWGDMNGDGIVNSEDQDILISMILNPLNGWKGIVPFEWYDLNNDGKLDVADLVTLILNGML